MRRKDDPKIDEVLEIFVSSILGNTYTTTPSHGAGAIFEGIYLGILGRKPHDLPDADLGIVELKTRRRNPGRIDNLTLFTKQPRDGFPKEFIKRAQDKSLTLTHTLEVDHENEKVYLGIEHPKFLQKSVFWHFDELRKPIREKLGTIALGEYEQDGSSVIFDSILHAGYNFEQFVECMETGKITPRVRIRSGKINVIFNTKLEDLPVVEDFSSIFNRFLFSFGKRKPYSH